MNERRQVEPSAGMGLGDVYFVLFRHKWKIIILAAAGLIAAAAFHLSQPPLYVSEAKLFIPYVLETRSASAIGGDSQIKPTDAGGHSIIDAEVEILGSLDLVEKVVDNVGAERILAKMGGGKDRAVAAAIVRGNLMVEAAAKASVIHIMFQHPDPEIVQPVLRELVSAYFKMHGEIHRSGGLSYDSLTQETDQLRSRLNDTEEALRKEKAKIGVISLGDAENSYAQQISKIQQDLLNAEAELEERQAALAALSQSSFLPVVETNKVREVKAAPPVPKEKAADYKRIWARLDALTKKESELMLQYTDENELLKEVRHQAAVVAKLKTDLEEQYPSLLTTPVISHEGAPKENNNNNLLLAAQSAQITALGAKIKVLNSQLERVKAEAASFADKEPAILELQRRKQLQETNYQYFATSLEKARINEQLGEGKLSNISQIQAPSPPVKDSAKSAKKVAMIGVSGIVAGLGWAFLMELFLDQSVKRPKDVEKRLKMRLFLSIPDANRKGFRNQARLNGSRRLLLNAGAENVLQTNGNGALEKAEPLDPAPWEPSHALHSYYEALRDRLVVHFEVINLTRTPKLVAVTSTGAGSGVSDIAAGLAACLSETGDGNVLLVDMNQEQGAAQQFFKGKPGCSLDEALDAETKSNTLVQENLYVVTEGVSNGKLPHILPKRFSNLVPKLKASDYDYIIFDMPPVNQTSVTPRLAGHMDIVLMVIEAEQTDREVVERANALLAESKAKVAAVLNKTRTYVPARLQPEL
ncbi:GumC family protein [Pedosphaera parvula]|uniref:Lipopolysaccharide biosynthesis protein n=1 Tax=Pedosphaera parvula (strain Ellin514) TaxID=320771 RepID=B9XD19_PEDPL|nr:tyrosine-protein kinase domain-containing protein [Pedosphaera parvula]EEF62365.1 lipopolysaccharide biosynthesis protein [Pedosphaera parvula Ellin514]